MTLSYHGNTSLVSNYLCLSSLICVPFPLLGEPGLHTSRISLRRVGFRKKLPDFLPDWAAMSIIDGRCDEGYTIVQPVV